MANDQLTDAELKVAAKTFMDKLAPGGKIRHSGDITMAAVVLSLALKVPVDEVTGLFDEIYVRGAERALEAFKVAGNSVGA